MSIELFQGASKSIVKPSEDLLPFINLYHQNTTNGTNGSEQLLLPHVGFCLIFNLGNKFRIKYQHHNYTVKESILLPRKKASFFVDPFNFFSIHFLFSFLPFTIYQSQSLFNSPSEIEISKALNEDIINADSFEKRVLLSNNFFGHLFKDHYNEISKVKFIVDKLHQLTDKQFDFSSSEKPAYVSSKTFFRHFLRYTGGSYKSSFRILRIRAALQSYFFEKTNFTPMLFGFYDHSHFYKEVQNITGFSLSKLRSLHMCRNLVVL